MSIVMLLHAEGIITLSHNGKHSYFKYNELQKAINNSAPEDTIFLSPGVFYASDNNYNLTIPGRTIIGSGSMHADEIYYDDYQVSTIVIENCDVTTGNVVLDGMILKSNQPNNYNYCMRIYSEVNTVNLLNMSWAWWNSDNHDDGPRIKISSKDSEKRIPKVNIERCDFSSNTLDYYNVEEFTIKNSFLNYIEGDGNSSDTYVTLTNCCILGWVDYVYGIGINSIVSQLGSTYGGFTWENSTGYVPSSIDCYSSADELIAAGLVGNDGTAIGPFGGKYPLTYNTDLLTIDYAHSSAEYIPNSKKLKVKSRIVETE